MFVKPGHDIVNWLYGRKYMAHGVTLNGHNLMSLWTEALENRLPMRHLSVNESNRLALNNNYKINLFKE